MESDIATHWNRWTDLPSFNHLLGELRACVRVDDCTVLVRANRLDTISADSGQTAKTFTELVVDRGTRGAV